MFNIKNKSDLVVFFLVFLHFLSLKSRFFSSQTEKAAAVPDGLDFQHWYNNKKTLSRLPSHISSSHCETVGSQEGSISQTMHAVKSAEHVSPETYFNELTELCTAHQSKSKSFKSEGLAFN